jgi:AcrR family transcriptional regulator
MVAKTTPKTRVGRISRGSSERREQQKLELRGLILKAAGEEFLEHGYENFSLRRVAERIGYTPTTIYLHFESKDDLLLETVQVGFRDFDHHIAEIANGEVDPLKRIEALGRAYICFGQENPALYRLMFMQRSDFYFMPRFVEPDAEIDEQVEILLSNPRQLPIGSEDRPRTVAMTALATAVQEAMENGVVQPGNPIITADVLWAGAHGLVSLSISPLMSPEHSQQVIDLLLKTLIDGIKVR